MKVLDAVRCPVCRGCGKVAIDSKGRLDTSVDAVHDKVCHGCGGTGWVVPK